MAPDLRPRPRRPGTWTESAANAGARQDTGNSTEISGWSAGHQPNATYPTQIDSNLEAGRASTPTVTLGRPRKNERTRSQRKRAIMPRTKRTKRHDDGACRTSSWRQIETVQDQRPHGRVNSTGRSGRYAKPWSASAAAPSTTHGPDAGRWTSTSPSVRERTRATPGHRCRDTCPETKRLEGRCLMPTLSREFTRGGGALSRGDPAALLESRAATHKGFLPQVRLGPRCRPAPARYATKHGLRRIQGLARFKRRRARVARPPLRKATPTRRSEPPIPGSVSAGTPSKGTCSGQIQPDARIPALPQARPERRQLQEGTTSLTAGTA